MTETFKWTLSSGLMGGYLPNTATDFVSTEADAVAAFADEVRYQIDGMCEHLVLDVERCVPCHAYSVVRKGMTLPDHGELFLEISQHHYVRLEREA